MFTNSGSEDKYIRRNQLAILRKEKLNAFFNLAFHVLTLGMMPMITFQPFSPDLNLKRIAEREKDLVKNS